ncbi:hypothetical protein D3C86_1665660 [compost metagenome]
MVPNRERTIPHFKNMLTSKGVFCVINAKVSTMIPPPKSMYKLLWAEDIPKAIRLAVNIVVVKEAAAINPQAIPRQSRVASVLIRLVANAVPAKTIITAIIFVVEGNFFSRNISSKTPIQTVCISNTIPIDTGM